MTHGGCGLATAQEIPLQMTKPPADVEPQKVHFGTDPNNMGLQVACVSVRIAPTREALKKIHAERLGKALFPLVVSASDGTTTWIFGPNPDSQTLELPSPQADRFLAAALAETSAFTAVQRFAQLRESLGTSRNLGVTNAGLFANHHLRENVPNRADWTDAAERARPWLAKRGRALIHALGFTDSRAAQDVLLLKPQDTSASRAVAILLNDDEHFEARSHRFNLTPIAYGLKVAAQHEVPWLIVLRQGQIRLYPAKDGVGVGQRSQADTYFELDLTMLADDHAALLALVFSAEALKPDGSTADILRGSSLYAISLGERLRDRIYEQVVPRLSTAVAEQLPALGLEANSENLVLAYRLTLRILFRLLFQAYAEDRGLLPFDRNERYTANALKTLVKRDLLPQDETAFDANSSALWDDLQQVWRVIDKGDSAWNVPAYNGGLFGTDPQRHTEGALLSRMALDNGVMGPVLRALLIDRSEEGVEGPVDFRSLSVREFGTVYEGLLESSLSLAEEDLTLDASGAWVPAKAGDKVEAAAGTAYFHNSSGERKATGSYFTPSILVEHLLDRALEPALEQHLGRVAELLDGGKDADAAVLFFDFRVADLAMGSAHFLVAAVDRIETAFRNFLVDHHITAVAAELQRLAEVARAALGDDAQFAGDIDEAMLLRRQIARRCIYGLDINEMAVELARLAIWIHTFVPGLPMSNLDHGLVCANSLTGIGTVEEALRVLDPQANDQLSIFTDAIEASLVGAKALLLDAAAASEATKQEIAAATELLAEAKAAAEPTRLIFDAAVAARLGVLNVTTFIDADAVLAQAQRAEVRELIDSLRPAHMPYLFPEVFLRERGGFDVLIGNPPWEELTVESDRYWRMVWPRLRELSQAEQAAEMAKIESLRPDLHQRLAEQIESAAAARRAILAVGFPGMGVGDPDLYKAFSWRNLELCRERGRIALVLPRSAWVAAGSALWRKELLLTAAVQLDLYRNDREWLFAGVNAAYQITTCSITKERSDSLHISGVFQNPDAFVSGRNSGVVLAIELLRQADPELCVPTLTSKGEIELWRHLMTFNPLGDGRNSLRSDLRCAPIRDLDASQDGRLAGVFTNDPADEPVYNHRNVGQHRFMPESGVFNYARFEAEVERQQQNRLRNGHQSRSAYSIRNQEWREDVSTLPLLNPRIAFRDVVHATNRRKAWFGLVPSKTMLTNAAPTLVFSDDDVRVQAYVLGILSSSIVDWYAHLRVNLHLNFFILYCLPVPIFVGSPLDLEIGALAGRLALTEYGEYGDWVDSFGPVVPNHARRDLEIKLEALVAEKFELSDSAMREIWDSGNDTRHAFEDISTARLEWKSRT